MVNLNTVVSFPHKMGMIRCLEDGETGRQLKCKICDVGLCIFVFQQVPYKGEIQLHETGCEACTYIKQVTIKMYVH
jgi:C4-type Zn-finger protein